MFKDKNNKRILFLGPRGSYTDQAKDIFVSRYGLVNVDEQPRKTIISILQELNAHDDKNVLAVVPIENSIEGVVRETLDNITRLSDVTIRILAEVVLPISHCLITRAKSCEDIKIVSSYHQGIAQCREFIDKTWGENIVIKPADSTSAAAKMLLDESSSVAAIASEKAALLYDLPILLRGINDEKDNKTRFVLIGREETLRADYNRTSISFSTENKPGALNKVLNILEKYNINMSYIDSRPSKKNLGEYTFYIDIDGHVKDEIVAKAIFEILQHVKLFRHIGSYEKFVE